MTLAEYQEIKVQAISGRYLPDSKCIPEFRARLTHFKEHIVGQSVLGVPIFSFRSGTGNTRILIWSQMHGNESTTTKALLDLFGFLEQGNGQELLKHLDLLVLPMLNPDGANAYTRENAAGKDLNRDAMDRSQPESHILAEAFHTFQPHFSFNLHDQRTIYNVGGEARPASLSFLAPAMDPQRSISTHRKLAMQLIVAITHSLPDTLKGSVGRYDDTFNPNCVGDQFQLKGSATILFEAGHVADDYEREISRYNVFRAILGALQAIATKVYLSQDTKAYFDIPENTRDYVDILIHHPAALHERFAGREKLMIHYQENLHSGRIQLDPEFPEEDLSTGKYGHLELDARNEKDRKAIEGIPGLRELLQ